MAENEPKLPRKTYTLTNNGVGPRVVHDVNNLPVMLQPGQTRHGVVLLEKFAQVLIDRKDDIAVTEAEQQAAAGAPEPKQPEADKPTVAQQQATELLAKADDLSIEELRAQAQTVLGDKWPGGAPKKPAIIEMLKTQAGAV